MASGLQCLLHAPDVEFYLDYKYPYNKYLLNSFRDLCLDTWKSESNLPLSPSYLKMYLSQKHRMYSGYDQLDSFEFVLKLLNEIHNEINSVPEIQKPYTGHKKYLKEELKQGAEESEINFKKRENSHIYDKWGGFFVSGFKCFECGYNPHQFEESLGINLQIPPNSKQTTLEKCFEFYTRKERLDSENKWYQTKEKKKNSYKILTIFFFKKKKRFCTKCERDVISEQQILISKVPEILMIQLKRFSEDYRSKDERLVEFPIKDLDLSLYVADYEENLKYYDLFAVSNHGGSLRGGHYWSKALVKDYWYKFDDMTVNKIDEKEVVDGSAIVLFYKRTGKKKKKKKSNFHKINKIIFRKINSKEIN